MNIYLFKNGTIYKELNSLNEVRIAQKEFYKIIFFNKTNGPYYTIETDIFSNTSSFKETLWDKFKGLFR